MHEHIMPTERDETDYYTLLGVSTDASPASIKAAFKRLALRYHPNVYHGADAQEQMRQILLAYRTLSNQAARRTYDARRTGSDSQRVAQQQQHSPAQAAAGNQIPGASRHARRDLTRPYAFPHLGTETSVRFSLGEVSYELSSQEAYRLQQHGFLRGIAPEAIGTLPADFQAATPHTCHRCQHRWIPAEGGPRRARLWELICPACKARDWAEYLLLRCVHCQAVFESEQVRDQLGPAAGKLYTPYELFPLCPFCGAARWCPAEDARLEALRVARRRRSGSFRARS